MKPLKSNNLDKHLLNTISYFSFFGYPPSFDEIHTFFPERITRKRLKTILNLLVKQKKLILQLSQAPPASLLYTLPQYAPHFKNRATRQVICQKKLIPVKFYTGILVKLPFIRFIGVTGSASMGNTTPHDDVDLFIITNRNCLFIGRFFVIVLAHILHVRKGKSRVCLNLFFDESNLVIPLQKQTPYVAHEVLQMRPVVDKGHVYERFLKANEWVRQFYPNALLLKNRHPERLPWKESRGIPLFKRFLHALRLVGMTALLIFPFEFLLKIIQLAIIRRNKTGLIISPTQLWLFKNDFETRVKNFKS